MTTHPLEPTATDFLAQQGDIAFQANLYDDANPTRRGLHRARPSHYDPVPRDVQQTLVSSRLADAE